MIKEKEKNQKDCFLSNISAAVVKINDNQVNYIVLIFQLFKISSRLIFSY
jgi:hypothetical protein